MSMPNTHSRIDEAMDDHEDIPWREMIDAMAMSSHTNELPLLMEEKYIRECIITLNKANVSPAESISGCPPQELQEADDELDEGEGEFHPSKLRTEEQKEMKKDACSQTATGAETGRKRRRRAMKKKNTEEVEYQRMVHITVERNRRRQMNDHLAVLRSLMPPSYIQRGDQASIVGGAIEFVKELEHTLQSLIQRRKNVCGANSSNPQLEEQSTHPFQTLVPQQRSQDSGCTSSSSSSSMDSSSSKSKSKSRSEGAEEGQQREVAFCGSCHAQVEVERVGPLFQVKVLSSSHAHGYLLRLITALQHSLGFIIRHLHITTSGHAIIYSVDVEPTAQVGENLISVHELAFSVHHIFGSQDLMDSVFS